MSSTRPGSPPALQPAQEEDDQPLVLADDVDHAGQQGDQHGQPDQQDDQTDQLAIH